MEIQIIITSILGYLVLFNSCLTFRLTVVNNIVITMIIAVNMVVVGNQMGSLFVLPMLSLLILYIVRLRREQWLINVLLIVFSYTLLVIVDNLTHFIWILAGLDIQIHWPLYMLIDYPIFYVLCRSLSKKAVKIQEQEFIKLSPKILAVLGADLILFMLIFILHITMVEQAGSTLSMIFSSVLLYIAYFLLTLLMITTLVREYEKNAKIMLKQNSYDNLQEYMTQIEELYQSLRGFRHDYANVMLSLAGYMEKNDMEGLKQYYDSQIFPISRQLHKENDTIARLHYLEIIELKSLISVKINYALEQKIEVSLEITEKIDQICMKCVDLIRILGVLLDNAIEACQESAQPYLSFSIIKTDEGVIFLLKNAYVKQKIDYSKIGTIGVSSKGERRGIGLYNVKSLINTYDNVIMDTEYGEGYFTQVLEIYDSKPESAEQPQCSAIK